MSILVQKYGGSSVATPEFVKAVADRIVACREEHHTIAVVVSAMGKTTDQLVALANQVSARPHGRDFDHLLAAGEQIAVSLLAIALQDRGVEAISLTAAQCGIRTDSQFNRARIQSIDTSRLRRELEAGKVAVIAGFQGITDTDEPTTLGRGGGDITGAAIAAALRAEICEICTDVDGVFTADPSVVPDAMLMPAITFEEAIELASSGAKVLHPRAAEICMEHQVPIHVRSSFHRRPGTLISSSAALQGANDMERPAVVGVTGDRKIAKVSLLNVPDEPGTAARIFEQLAEHEVNIRLIIQSAAAQHRAGITFITDADLVDRVAGLVPRWKEGGLVSEVEIDRAVAKIAIVGSRLSSTPGLAARMFSVLGREKINIDCISSSEMKIACIVAAGDLDRAVRAVHGEFFGQPAAGESVA